MSAAIVAHGTLASLRIAAVRGLVFQAPTKRTVAVNVGVLWILASAVSACLPPSRRCFHRRLSTANLCSSRTRRAVESILGTHRQPLRRETVEGRAPRKTVPLFQILQKWD